MKPHINTLLIALAIIICACILGNTYTYKYKTQESITVTGLAEKDFSSDQIVWTADYNRKSTELKQAYALLKQDEKTIREYLRAQGVKDEETVFSAVGIEKEYGTKYDNEGRATGSYFTGYVLRQSISIDSRDLEKVEALSRSATSLIEDGIEFNSHAPSYYYTKLSELKIDLLAKASADARLRAETIAKNSGGHLGKTLKANMGVFQITGQNSNEDYSFGGAFNTASKMKTASITVRAEYAAR